MTEKPKAPLVYDVEGVKRLLPHREPFLFLEKLTDIVDGESAVGHKAVGYNEPHFRGHFPDHAVMPGVLIVEAMAQTAGALVIHTMGVSAANRIVYFMTIEKARFRKPVRPGDMLRLPVKALRRRGPVWRFSGEAYVDGALCAEAEFSAMIQESTNKDVDSSDGNH